jgi:hypothetical protein
MQSILKNFPTDHDLEFGYSLVSKEMKKFSLIVHQYDRFKNFRTTLRIARP